MAQLPENRTSIELDEEATRAAEAMIRLAVDGDLFVAEGVLIGETEEDVLWVAITVRGMPIGMRHMLTKEEARVIGTDLLAFANGEAS